MNRKTFQQVSIFMLHWSYSFLDFYPIECVLDLILGHHKNISHVNAMTTIVLNVGLSPLQTVFFCSIFQNPFYVFLVTMGTICKFLVRVANLLIRTKLFHFLATETSFQANITNYNLVITQSDLNEIPRNHLPIGQKSNKSNQKC